MSQYVQTVMVKGQLRREYVPEVKDLHKSALLLVKVEEPSAKNSGIPRSCRRARTPVAIRSVMRSPEETAQSEENVPLPGRNQRRHQEHQQTFWLANWVDMQKEGGSWWRSWAGLPGMRRWLTEDGEEGVAARWGEKKTHGGVQG